MNTIVLKQFRNNLWLRSSVKQFSLQSTIESVAKTQTNIFTSLSQSKPVEYSQNLLINIHDYTGLPWWATIMCTTVLLRSTVTVPLAIYQNYIMAKLENLNLEMGEIVKELKVETAMAVKMFNWDEKTTRIRYKRALREQWQKLILRDNCHPLKASILVLVQIPMWVSVSISLRNLVYMLPITDGKAEWIFTEMSIGGFGWIHNLTIPDPTFILPITLCVLNLAIIEVQVLSKVRVPSKFQRYVTNFFRVFCLSLLPISASVPSCLVLYWTTSSAFGLIQNLVLMSPNMKRICRIPETPSELEHPYKHLYLGVKHKLHLN